MQVYNHIYENQILPSSLEERRLLRYFNNVGVGPDTNELAEKWLQIWNTETSITITWSSHRRKIKFHTFEDFLGDCQ